MLQIAYYPTAKGVDVQMREIDERYEDYSPKRKRKLKHPGRFIVFIIAFAICLWMVFNFVIALGTGQKFSFLGNGGKTIQNVVVAGVDEGGYRTDLILLCQINKRTGALNILQIPRDTKVTNRRNDKKINSAYFSGFDCMSGEIEQVTGIKPENYVMIGFDGFNDVIDAMGGVVVDVPVRMNYTDPVQNLTIDLQPGKQKLDGEHAQMFMRFRKNNDGTGYVNGDIDRIEAQKKLYAAVVKRILSPAGIVHAPAVFSAVKSNSETNLSGGELFSMMKDAASVAGNVNFYTLPGEGKYIGGGSYFVYDKQKTADLISEHFVTSK